jgi:pyridoxal 5'-phosphate synthase pdxT subunit
MIGILALQGGFKEHESILDRLGLPWREVRSLADTDGLMGLIIPGGESTVMDLFMEKFGLQQWLMERAKDPRFVVFGTCAGLILLARYGLLHAEVLRNAYGRQLSSFTAVLQVQNPISSVAAFPVKAHFIRAPKIVSLGEAVSVLATHEGVPVLIREGNVWGASFHPELAGEASLHSAIFSC